MASLSETKIKALVRCAVDQFMYEHADAVAEACETMELERKFREILKSRERPDAPALKDKP